MSLAKGMRPLARCVNCADCTSTWVLPMRSFSCSSATKDLETNTSSPSEPPPDPSSSARTAQNAKTGQKNPYKVNSKIGERLLFQQQGLMPIGSRRRRMALATTRNSIPFAQLPYQCFQEARKFLQEDREEKLARIRVQRERIERLRSSEVEPQDEEMKERRLASMNTTLEELKILADSNDPLVKKRFEDGKGDLNKPIYRLFAERKWREYKRKLLVQRIEQMHVVPDVYPKVDPTVSTTLYFNRRKIPHGAFVDSLASETAPHIDIQPYNKGQRLVTIAVVTPDVPDVAKDGFDYRCHFLASNVAISPTDTRVDLAALDAKSQIILPWLAPWAQKGAPYHRMSVWILQQSPTTKPLTTPTHEIDVGAIAEAGRYTKREGFNLRSFITKYQLNPVGVDLFRTKWDENMSQVMQRAGVIGANVEFKPKRIEPLPYFRKSTERYR